MLAVRMADTWEEVERLRFEQMKIFRVQKLSFADMVPRLRALELLSCQNCENGTPRIRTTKSGKEVCRTCENTISVFWKRNVTRLSEDELDLLDARWEWLAGKKHIQRICLARHVQKVIITTTRSETVADADGKPTTQDIVTTREETRIYPELLRLYDQIGDSIARASGINTEDPTSARPTLPVELHVHERDSDDRYGAN